MFTRSLSEKNVASSMFEVAGSGQVVEGGVLSGSVPFQVEPMQQVGFRNKASVDQSVRRQAAVFEVSPLPVDKKRKREASSSDSEGSARGARYQRHQERYQLQFENPTLVFDRRGRSSLNTRLRGSYDLSALSPESNQKGLSDLKLSGSAAITASMLQELQAATGSYPVLVIDLRREPHAVLNEHSVTWTVPNNWLNSDKTLDAAVQDEQSRVDQIRNSTPESIVAIHHKDYKKELNRPLHRVFKQPEVFSERELVEAFGMSYLRLGVADHLRPSDEEVQRFLDTVCTLPSNAWVHAHCKGGQGRTTTFMVLYDILRNAHRVSLSDIVDRHRHLGFGYDVSSEGLKEERRQFRKERWAFISDFYRFVQANPSVGSWKDWVAQK